MDASILDMSVELVGEIPVKTKTTLSPKLVSQDFIRHLGIVTPKQGRADVATPISHYNAELHRKASKSQYYSSLFAIFCFALCLVG